jgi:hypothetical protein
MQISKQAHHIINGRIQSCHVLIIQPVEEYIGDGGSEGRGEGAQVVGARG